MEPKLLTQKIFACLAIVLCLVPAIVTPVIAAQEFPSEISFNPKEEDEKVRRVILYKKGALGNFLSSDIYHMKLKEGAQYMFWAKINIEGGIFSLAIDGPGGTKSEVKDWNQDDPESEHVISFYFTPDDGGDHTVVIASLAASDGGDYRLYANRAGFAGYWWMIAAGVGALIVLIFVIVLVIKILK
ncbi:MAG: hypothetical protein GF308_05680 [Candidatus Heimdallarchaeota archaeon]|nr:hypothetical protein [Candidatus Heimdallarchaeota archaeon]